SLPMSVRRWVFLVLLALLPGCERSGPTMQQRQDAALRDPFSYGPTPESMQDPRRSQVWEFDRKGMNHDLESVFNP
ncbi:MAG TPA: hypothetical protein PKB10_04310, partial [Tepidisphaeraceae bacterium]|nr:hypothetical protein [Tepidisphaeraceae bacterium]